ncbi:MAG TPA: hypothetical protein VLV48_00080, partial [Thermoanaerobaculia bacterium]|nr:hypothetical protein [Thermoanaerobaculia bacterium]
MMVAGEVRTPDGSSIATGGSIVDAKARVEGQLIESVAAGGASIARGATVRNSVLWDAASVAPGARVTGAVIGRGVSVPAGAVVEGALVCRRLADVEYPEGTILAGEFAVAEIRPGSGRVENLG